MTYTCNQTMNEDRMGSSNLILDVEAGREVRIVQMTDLQITDVEKTRNKLRKRQITDAFFSNGVFDDEIKVYRYMDEAVKRAKPDLIVLGGDNIYGETDDNGSIWKKLIEKLDTYKIPWATCFGNHDNESAKGVEWQVKKIERSQYGIFARSTVSGNSNYGILIRQNGKISCQVYMIDSNDCKKLGQPGEGIRLSNKDYDKLIHDAVICKDQIEWFKNSAQNVNNECGRIVPSLVFVHIPLRRMYDAYEEKYHINSSSLIADIDGDFGAVYDFSPPTDNDSSFFNTAKKVGTIGMLFSHCHYNSASIVFDGVRMTFGLKTGTHTFYRKDSLGSTLATVNNGQLGVEHIYTNLTHEDDL